MAQVSLCPSSESGPRPDWSVRKFDDAGQVLPTPGLTLICHIDPASSSHSALCRVQDGLRRGAHSSAFAFLPPDSFHMTVFDGVIDYDRSPDGWPRDLPTEATLDNVEAHWCNRVHDLDLQRRFAIEVTQVAGGYTCLVRGADDEQETALRTCRDQVSHALSLRRPNHDVYQFHITLAYQITWLDPEAAAEVVTLSSQLFADHRAALRKIDIGPIEFCRFKDMTRFDAVTCG